MKSSHATAAAQIRAELKANFPGFKFSVNSHSYTGGDSIRVKWTDGPSYKKVNEIVSKYQAGHFNGMEDIYEYGERVEGIEQVKYVFAERTVSEQNKKAAQISLHIPDEEMNAYWSEQQVYRKCQETSYDMEGNVVVEPVEVISEQIVTVTEQPTEQTALELLKSMLYIIQKNEGEIRMNMPESMDYDKALAFIRDK